MKGNDGRAARRQLFRRLGIVIGIFGICISILAFLGFGGVYRRRQRHYALVAALWERGFGSSSSSQRQQQQKQQKWDTRPLIKSEKDVEQMILAGSLHLVDLEVDYEELAYSSSESYGGVYGRFCQVNFAAHKQNPTEVPMFRDLVGASPDCSRVYWKMDLQRITQMARNLDRQSSSHSDNNNNKKVHNLNLTAVIFHESRCGSTLVANALMAMNPDQHRVYSESTPPLVALRLCGDLYENCHIDQAVKVFQDVLYLMGRSNDPQETRVYYKIQSIGTRYIDVFLQAFPTTPWLFVFRDPVQVMMSHLGVGDTMVYANCVRQYSQPPPAVMEMLERRLDTSSHQELQPQDVSYEDYCAAHLAVLTERALDALRTSKYGHAIHYPDLPQVLYQHVIPNQLGVALSEQQMARIVHVSSLYSKGKRGAAYQQQGGGSGGDWHEDSQRKERRATQTIKAAAKLFLQSSYDELIKMSQQQ